MKNYDRYLIRFIEWCFLVFAFILIMALFWTSQRTEAQSNTRPDLFRQCANNIDSQSVNVVWNNGFNYTESTRSQAVIDAVLNLVGNPVSWDSSVGAYYPDGIQERVTETIGITLSDGTVVSFIITSWYADRLYGWLTFSTYRTTTSYNPIPNPHVLCGFWSIREADRNQLRQLFRAELEQWRLREEWMR